jgi:hypothetical protein
MKGKFWRNGRVSFDKQLAPQTALPGVAAWG